jgi:hypothetical protein
MTNDHRLKRSLWYGMKDLGSELIGRSKSHKALRKDEFWAVEPHQTIFFGMKEKSYEEINNNTSR